MLQCLKKKVLADHEIGGVEGVGQIGHKSPTYTLSNFFKKLTVAFIYLDT